MGKRWMVSLLAALLTVPAGLPTAAAQDAPQSALYWVPTTMEKVLRDGQAPQDGAQALRMEAARNEYESGQIIVRADTAALTNVTAAASALTLDGGGAQIAAGDVRVYKEHYVEVTSVTTGIYPKGWYPDALIPLAPNDAFDVALGQNQGIWITVKVPKGQQPGTYQGNIAIRGDGLTIDVPLSLHVWDFELSDGGHTQTAFAIWGSQVAAYHGVAVNSPDYWQLLENYYWYQTEYRLPPDDLPIPTDNVDLYVEQAERFLENPKVTSYRIPYYENNPVKTKDMVEKLRANDLLEKGYFYLGILDEPGIDKYPLVRQISEELAEIAPEVKHIVTKEPVGELEGYVNTWAIPLQVYDSDTARARQAAGDHVWWYTSVVPKAPYPTYHIDDNLLGARLLSWMQRDHKVEGNLLWATTIFRKYNGTQYVDRNVWQDPLAYPGANGDGYLLYPGKDLGINGPIATVRIEAIRDGMEDYEYLWLFEERMRAAASRLGLTSFDVDAVMRSYYDRLYTSISSYKDHPEGLLQVRREIAEQIVALEQNPTVLYTVTRLEDLKEQVTVYAELNAQVQLGGIPVQPTVQHPQYAEYVQSFDLQIGVNEVELAVSSGGVTKSQTIRLIGIATPPPEYTIPLLNAEAPNDVERWTLNQVELSFSTERAMEGERALKAVFQPNVDFPNMRLLSAGHGFRSADWSGYDRLEFEVYNDEEAPQLFYIKFFDENGVSFDGINATVGPKASRTVQIPLDSVMRVDLSRMRGLELWMWKKAAPVTLYLDNFRFIAGEALPTQDMAFQLVKKVDAADLTVEGSLNETAWQVDQEYRYAAYRNSDNTGRFGVLWNDTYLYAAFEIEDNDARDPSHARAPWDDDGVELFIDGDYVKGPRNEHAPQYTVRLNDNQVFLNGALNPATAGIIQGSTRTGTGYTVEMAIPWAAIGVTPASGKTIGITSHVNDEDVVNGVRTYGVLGYTLYGLEDGATSERWGEFILLPGNPAAPGQLTAAPQDAAVDLSWEAAAEADSYTVFKYAGASAPSDSNAWVEVQAGIQDTTYTVAGLTNDTTYTFAVKAVNRVGTGNFSAAVTATPMTPTTVAVIREQLEQYEQSQDLKKPLTNQLGNSLRQAEHHWSKGHAKQAVKSLRDFIKHLNNPAHQQRVSEQAAFLLMLRVEALIANWEAAAGS